MQIFLRMRPAAILLHGAAATNPRFKGTGCSGQRGSPKELRASGAPLRQAAEGRRPQRYMLALKRPTPVRRCFKDWWPTLCEGDQLLVGCLYQGDGELHRLYIVSCQSCFHCSIRLKLEFARDAAWRLKGRRERNVGVGGWGFGLLQCGHVKGDERCLVEPS